MSYQKYMGVLSAADGVFCPDYSNPVDVTTEFNSKNTWTAPSSGWISVYISVSYYGGTHTVFINGTAISSSNGAGGDDDNDGATTIVPIKEGDVVTIQRRRGTGVSRMLFFPD